MTLRISSRGEIWTCDALQKNLMKVEIVAMKDMTVDEAHDFFKIKATRGVRGKHANLLPVSNATHQPYYVHFTDISVGGTNYTAIEHVATVSTPTYYEPGDYIPTIVEIRENNAKKTNNDKSVEDLTDEIERLNAKIAHDASTKPVFQPNQATGMKNYDNVLMEKGTNINETYYCGVFKHTSEFYPSAETSFENSDYSVPDDNICGPFSGPQCMACKVGQDFTVFPTGTADITDLSKFSTIFASYLDPYVRTLGKKHDTVEIMNMSNGSAHAIKLIFATALQTLSEQVAHFNSQTQGDTYEMMDMSKMIFSINHCEGVIRLKDMLRKSTIDITIQIESVDEGTSRKARHNSMNSYGWSKRFTKCFFSFKLGRDTSSRD